jgi:hypothetical protein
VNRDVISLKGYLLERVSLERVSVWWWCRDGGGVSVVDWEKQNISKETGSWRTRFTIQHSHLRCTELRNPKF